MAHLQDKANVAQLVERRLPKPKQPHIGPVCPNQNRQTNQPISSTFATEASTDTGITIDAWSRRSRFVVASKPPAQRCQ